MALKMASAGQLEGVAGEQVILLARAYARKNGGIFDGTLRGALRLLEEADRMVRQYAELAAREKTSVFDKPGKTILTTPQQGRRVIDESDKHLLREN